MDRAAAGLSLPQRASLAAVLCTTVGVGLIFGFQPPLVAFVLERGHASSFEIGAVTSASTVAVIGFGPLYPRLIARLGLRGAIVAGTAIAVVVLLLMPVLQGISWWIAFRFVTGCALGLAWIASEIWLNTLSTDESRGRVMAIYATVFALGVMAGPLLLQVSGTAGWLPFYIGAISLAVTAAPLLWVHTPEVSDGESYRTRLLVQTLRGAPVVMLAALIAGLIESADVSLLPVFGLQSGLGERPSLLLVTVFLAGNVFLQLPIGSLADWAGRRLVRVPPIANRKSCRLGGSASRARRLCGREYPRPALAAAIHAHARGVMALDVCLGWDDVRLLHPGDRVARRVVRTA